MNKQIEETDLKVLIYNIIKKRITKFNFEEIDNIIKQELGTKNILNKNFLSKTLYYDNTLLEVLEFLMEKGELHSINGWYVPENALPKQNYQVQNMELVYSYGLIRGNDHYIDDIEYLYDIETMQEIIKKDRQRRAILTGELIGGEIMNNQKFLYMK